MRLRERCCCGAEIEADDVLGGDPLAREAIHDELADFEKRHEECVKVWKAKTIEEAANCLPGTGPGDMT